MSTVLYVLHVPIEHGEGFVGGTQLHVLSLLQSSQKAYLLHYEPGYLKLTRYEDGYITLSQSFLVNPILQPFAEAEDYRQVYRMILSVYEIDVVHIHHFYNHSVSIVEETKRAGLGLLITAHDFYMLCPAIYLSNHENRYCAGEIELLTCARCLAVAVSVPFKIESPKSWREQMEKALIIADYVIAPSLYAAEMFERFYPAICILVIEHGLNVHRLSPSSYQGGVFRVAFVGNMVPHKGSRAVMELIKKCKDSEIEFHIFGKLEDLELEACVSPKLHKHGGYQPGQLQRLLHENCIHVVLFLSSCAESFCFTLSETWQCGIPVIACELGALGTRIRASGAGILVEQPKAARQSLECILKLKKDRILYERLTRLSEGVPQRSIADMIDEYQNIYDGFAKVTPAVASVLADFIGLYFNAKKPVLPLLQCSSANFELVFFKNSLTYKLSQKVKRFPGQRFLKKLLMFFLR